MYLICGIGLKVMHTSTDNIASIHFNSDHIVVKAGFNITFTTIEGVLLLILFKKNSFFISINRFSYPAILKCAWYYSIFPVL